MVAMIQDVAFSRCIECNNLALIVDYRAGEIVCTNCGEVNQSRIVDERDEFIQYQDDDRPRSGGTRSSGMAETAIGYYYTTFDVNTGTENQRKLLTRLQYEMTDKTEINLVNNLDIVREICGQLHVPQDIKQRSIEIFRRAIEEKKVKPRAIPLCAAASVYHGCRIAGYPRTVEEIGTVIGINGKDINRMQGYLLRELNLSHGRITASNLVNRFSSLLGLPYSVVQQIQELCSSINSYELLDGKSPQTCAAVAILIVCFCTSRVINLDNLCSISLTSRSGIEQTYNKLYQHLSLLLLSQNIKKVIVGAAVTANKELKIVENRNCSNTNGCESSIPSTDDVPDIPAGIKIGNLQDFLPKSLSMALVEGTSYTMRLRNFILKNLAKSRIKKLLKLSLEAVNSESSGTSASRTSIVSKANSGAIAEAKSLNSVDDVSEISGTKRNIDSYEAIPEATLKKQRVL